MPYHRSTTFIALLLVACGADDTAQLSIPDDAGREASVLDARSDYSSPTRPPKADSGPGATRDARLPSEAFQDTRSRDAPDVLAETSILPPNSLFCGDSIRDPVTEECDDGPGSTPDACSADCRVHNVPVVAPPLTTDATALTFERDLGTGRHVASASPSAFGIVYVERHPEAEVWLQAFDPWGRRSDDPLNVASQSLPTAAASPVVATLPNGRFAVSWTDAAAGNPDVVLVAVDPGARSIGQPVTVHTSPSGPQSGGEEK